MGDADIVREVKAELLSLYNEIHALEVRVDTSKSMTLGEYDDELNGLFASYAEKIVDMLWDADNIVELPMRPREDQYCENCMYFDLDVFEEGSRESWCNRYPPVFLGPALSGFDEDEDEILDRAYWNNPIVAIRNWCGEWKAREDG